MKSHISLFLAAVILLSACNPTEISPTATATLAPPSKTPSPIPTATQTPTPPPTATVSPTPTPAPFAALKAVSLQYLAPTEADAVKVAESLGYLISGAHPSNMCGPLAGAILRESGVISPYIDLYDFWLLNPRVHAAKIARIFPKNRFRLTEAHTSLLDYDFVENPLESGDFLYLYAGPNGNFEHMLTVTRVDEMGRAYTVTNVNTDDGYIIDEFMLYDPNAPGEGLFYRWNDRNYDYLGLTGSGGFDLWHPLKKWDAGDAALTASINGILDKTGGEWHILIKKTDGERLYARSIHEKIHIASAIKIPIALLFFKSIEDDAENLPEYLTSHAMDGRSYEQLLYAMLVNSEESATGSLYNVIIRNRLNIEETLHAWGIEDINIPYRKATLYDLSLILEGLYQHHFVSAEASEMIINLMGVYTENDDIRTGVLKEYFPQAKIYNKRGTLTAEFLVIGDIAIIEIEEEDYLFLIFGLQDKNLSMNNTELNDTIEEIMRAFGKYLQEQ